MTADIPVFDGHNDVLLKLWSDGPGAVARFVGGCGGQVDLPRARDGGLVGGFFALFARSESPLWWDHGEVSPYDQPMPAVLDPALARRVVDEQVEILAALAAAGALAICRTAAEIRVAMAAGRIAAVMHLEGAEAIGPDLEGLDRLHAQGLRSLGPVWSRPCHFGRGVPFRHPSDGDIGPGLTPAGRRLVAAAAAKRMIVDTSHLNMRGFFEVGGMGLPLVATHSNAHAVCPHARNLTDVQLRAIGETGGMVGLNFATAFLRPDGRMVPEGALDWMLRHLDRMIELAGEDHVGLGSDFDGAMVPEEIGSVAGLGVLVARMRQAGYGEALLEKVCRENWIAAIGRIVG